MITGTRALVPELREVPGLRFDVMPIPSIEGQATVGEITGLCISQDAESPATAADFMVYASSTEAVSEVVREGYLQPANQEVAFSDDFLQPTELPASGTVFNESVGRMVIPPLLDTWDELETAVEPYLREMFYAVPTIDLPLIGEQIDAGLAADPQSRDGDADSSDGVDGRRTRRTPRLVPSEAPSAASTASARIGAVRRTCQARAPRSRSATEIAWVRGSRSRVAGGVHSTRRTKSGVSRFSAGSRSSSDGRGDGLARQLEPPGRDGVLVGPGPRWRRPVGARGARRQLGLREVAYLRQHRDPAAGVAVGSASVEPLGRLEGGPGRRHRQRGGHDRRVGDDPARRHVALGGDLVAGGPQRAYGAQGPAAADLVQARRTPPLVHAGRAG